MAERPQMFAPTDLERSLIDLGGRLDYPPTPPLAALARDRLAAAPRRQGWQWPALPFRRALAYGLLALFLLGGALLLASPEARTAVADRLGLRGINIIQTPPQPTPTASPAGASLRLGRPVTLQEARERAGYPLAVPAAEGLGEPDEIYLDESAPGGKVTLLYRARPGLPAAAETGIGLMATQFQGELNPSLMNKGAGPGTRLTQLSVNGAPGYWIEGEPHFFFYRDERGQVREETLRLAGNTLIWEHGERTLRLEGPLSREEALRIANSMR